MPGQAGSLTSGWLTQGILVLYAIVFLLAIAILIDQGRRGDYAFGRLGRWPWIVLQAAFVFATIVAVLGGVLHFSRMLGATYGLVLLVLMVAALIQQFAYALRIVFPKSTEDGDFPESESETEEGSGHT